MYRINVSDRSALFEEAKAASIELGIHYKCLHKGTIYSTNSNDNFIMSEFDSDTTVSIPFHEKLTDENIEEVIKLVLKHDNIEYS